MKAEREVGQGYIFYDVYQRLRRKIIDFAPPEISVEVGTTAHYGLPDFRLVWNGIRLIGMFPRPKGVEVLLEYNKFMDNRSLYDPGLIDQFEDAAGALIVNKNRLLVVRALDELDEEYLDTYLQTGMQLYLAELKRRHPSES